jgi:NADPH2:quinone reductase
VRAVTIKDKRLSVEDHPDPQPGSGEVLIAVRAAGLNGADQMQLKGHYPPPPYAPKDIPGLELAGEVVAVGPNAERFAVGDRVMGITGGGGQAELATVHERGLMPVPDGVEWAAAGGFPETFTTAYDAIVTRGQLMAGERLLVHGAAGGVGTAAVQIGRRAGAQVTATVRNEAHRDAVAKLGATAIAPEGFAEHGPFDVILELVGAINLADNLQALDVEGRLAIIGTGAGATAEINLGMLMMKRTRIFGSTLRARPLELKALTARAVERSLLPALGAGELTVPIAQTFALQDAADAYERFAAGGKLGKVILTIGG